MVNMEVERMDGLTKDDELRVQTYPQIVHSRLDSHAIRP